MPTSLEVMSSVSGWTSTPVTELAIVIWRPSRIHAAPRPATMRVWNGDQLRRSSRAGIVLRILVPATSAVLTRSSLRSAPLEELGDHDPGGRLHQCEMGERLREVAEVPAGLSVELLGVEAERGRNPKQLLHEVAGALELADDRERRDEPERA